MSHIRTPCCDHDVCLIHSEARSEAAERRVAMLSVHTCPLAMLGGESTGGMNVYVRELSRELGRRGWAVDIYTHAETLDRPAVIPVGNNVRVIHTVAGPVKHIGKNELYKYLPEFAENVLAMVASEGIVYDVIHSHYWLSGLVAERLRAVWNAPMLQMFHTLGEMKNQVAQRAEERELDVRISSERRLMQGADRVVATTPLDRQQMLDLYGADPEKIEIISCGVDLSLFRPIPRLEARREVGLAPESRVILFVGRIEPLKGLDTLLRAVSIVANRNPEWRDDLRLVVVGGEAEGVADPSNAEMRRARRLRAELGLAEQVAFVGAQSQETLPYFYSAADVLAMPSHYESFGLVALEAMASGIPVIASNVGGLSYTVQHGKTGLLVPPRDPDCLAAALEHALANPGLRTRLGMAGVVRARRFGWPNVAEQVLRLYGQLQQERV